ncbi:hypothetical protein SeseC_00522 [Streptococcus equi subsp. zooepidemicus ATCC 35246]|nr:hypothetical protein SeseC_00522 [Streptococcus equi subsp. zooepidemicus ATCC 35246]AIA68868.1 hypothetical protein Q426_07080 [Streptococcus equi subsp. zooepidemicus CY]
MLSTLLSKLGKNPFLSYKLIHLGLSQPTKANRSAIAL